MLYSCLPEFSHSLFDFFNLVDLQLLVALLYDSLNLMTSGSGLLGAVAQEK